MAACLGMVGASPNQDWRHMAVVVLKEHAEFIGANRKATQSRVAPLNWFSFSLDQLGHALEHASDAAQFANELNANVAEPVVNQHMKRIAKVRAFIVDMLLDIGRENMP